MATNQIYTTGNTLVNSPYTITLSGGSGYGINTMAGGNGTWATTGTSYAIWESHKPSANVQISSGGIRMDSDCDITFGNVSLKETLESIQSRLAILKPNPLLEEEWEELRALGDAYRALEKEIGEKMQVWNALKKVDE